MTREGEVHHWFEHLADHLGSAYLKYSFTRGTRSEVDYLIGALGIGPGDRVLDLGCGPGRHSNELASRGITVVGLDVAAAFLEVAAADAKTAAGEAEQGAPASWVRADALRIPFASGSFDVAISLCQGAFGLGGGPAAGTRIDPDLEVLSEFARVLAPGGRLAMTAFSSYFQVRYLADDDDFDAERGVNHETTEVRSPDGTTAPVEMWTTCFTPRELRLMASACGLVPLGVHSVSPGRYSDAAPNIEEPEFLLLAQRTGEKVPFEC